MVFEVNVPLLEHLLDLRQEALEVVLVGLHRLVCLLQPVVLLDLRLQGNFDVSLQLLNDLLLLECLLVMVDLLVLQLLLQLRDLQILLAYLT